MLSNSSKYLACVALIALLSGCATSAPPLPPERASYVSGIAAG